MNKERTLQFVTEGSRHFKVETERMEIFVEEIPEQIIFVEKKIAMLTAELDTMNALLFELKNFSKKA